MKIYASDLFNLSDFLFPEIIADSHFVWDILDSLIAFLGSHFYKGIQGTVEEGVFFKNKETIEISEGAYIESGSYIVGPCIIGAGSVVRHGAYIRGGVVCGTNCVIGHATELKNVYLGNNVKAAHFAYAGDSVFGADVNLGAGVRCANLRLDSQNIKIKFLEEMLDTGKKKVGAFLGRGVSIGCNVVINPGKILEAYQQVFPGKVF